MSLAACVRKTPGIYQDKLAFPTEIGLRNQMPSEVPSCHKLRSTASADRAIDTSSPEAVSVAFGAHLIRTENWLDALIFFVKAPTGVPVVNQDSRFNSSPDWLPILREPAGEARTGR